MLIFSEEPGAQEAPEKCLFLEVLALGLPSLALSCLIASGKREVKMPFQAEQNAGRTGNCGERSVNHPWCAHGAPSAEKGNGPLLLAACTCTPPGPGDVPTAFEWPEASDFITALMTPNASPWRLMSR